MGNVAAGLGLLVASASRSNTSVAGGSASSSANCGSSVSTTGIGAAVHIVDLKGGKPKDLIPLLAANVEARKAQLEVETVTAAPFIASGFALRSALAAQMEAVCAEAAMRKLLHDEAVAPCGPCPDHMVRASRSRRRSSFGSGTASGMHRERPRSASQSRSGGFGSSSARGLIPENHLQPESA